VKLEMLEHGTGPSDAPETGGGSAAAGIREPDHYVPPHKPEALTGRGKAPSVKRFNPKMIVGIAVIGGAVIALAFAVGLQKPKPKAAPAVETAAAPPVPGPEIAALPNNYDAVPQLGEPRPGDLGAMGTLRGSSTDSNAAAHQLTPLEQYAQTAELDRLRNEDRARTATVSFGNAGNDASTATQPNNPADSTQALQGRLLDLAQRGGPAPVATPASATLSTRDDANRQDDKTEFADRPRGSDFNLHASLQRPRSPYTLFAGTILPCVLTQGINSDLPGQIGCMISENVYDTATGHYLLLPQGTKVIGTYDSRIAYGQSRVLVVWTRLLRPDGGTLSLEGMPGVDLSGYAGISGHVNNHYLRLLTGVVLGSLIGASAQIAVGANSQNPSFAQLAIQGAGQNINEAGQQVTRKNLNIQPTIEVRPGGRLNIFATKDIILPPWVER
jgi:type IV secretory pathway VirB10-like protein